MEFLQWDVLIALFGGIAGAIGNTRQKKGNAVPGVAIATALMPPLCTTGYGLVTMQHYGIEKHMVNLEITETAASNSPKMLLKNMLKLSGEGVTFSMDDFGTGYSNISSTASYFSKPLPEAQFIEYLKNFLDKSAG